jgi:drug/metabolite transporter (DMT)-like permease
MWQTIILGFLGGVMGGNAFPHFVHGITRKRYPNVTGNGPIPNLIAGWAGLVLAALLIYWAHGDRHPTWTFGFAALGVLLIGLFHAGPGAFGRPDAPE